MSIAEKPKISALVPWYGSNRMLAEQAAKLLNGRAFVAVPFGGSLAEVFHMQARTVLVNDKHRHLINLARVVASEELGPKLYRKARRILFDADPLKAAQVACIHNEGLSDKTWATMTADERLGVALNYWVACWMARSANAGTKGEFRGGLPLRWNAGGGDSALRYQNATASLPAFRRTLRRCTFSCLDFREFLSNVPDTEEVGIYSDAPFPGEAGERYRFTFTPADHQWLAEYLGSRQKARVVCRFYDDPVVRQLYPEGYWVWHYLKGRTQANGEAPEVLITNKRAA